MNVYERAGKIMTSYIKSNSYDRNPEEVRKDFKYFKGKYSWRVLSDMKPKTRLTILFGWKKGCLAYDLLGNDKYGYLGSIGGRQVKSTCPVYEKNGSWYAKKGERVTEDVAISISEEFYNEFEMVQRKIEELCPLDSFDKYREISDLIDEMHYYRQKNWHQKILHLLFPAEFVEMYSEEWQRKALCVFLISPMNTAICRNGQLNMVAKNTPCEDGWQFANMFYHIFGWINKATVIKYVIDDNVRIDDWFSERVIGLIDSNRIRNAKNILEDGCVTRDIIAVEQKGRIVGIADGLDRREWEYKRDSIYEYYKRCNWIKPSSDIWIEQEDDEGRAVSKILNEGNLMLFRRECLRK